MEILIPGLALVALMVYVSTRIKRSAAKAYDEEVVETDEFTITKPEGFLIPNQANEVAFAAYSKEFGTGDAGSVRQVSAEIRIHDGITPEAIRNAIVTEAKVVSEQHLAGGSMILETEKTENGVLLVAERRLVVKDGRVFELAVVALSETKETQQRNIDALLSSFEVK